RRESKWRSTAEEASSDSVSGALSHLATAEETDAMPASVDALSASEARQDGSRRTCIAKSNPFLAIAPPSALATVPASAPAPRLPGSISMLNLLLHPPGGSS